ncbi:toll/interleukin-1 receptor-like protein [Cucurbita maxima]|uniref:Toll/interleukin-1 receptor-like protein n=1 Tax=Cucurbita maxima TaxID=3661 RepID=A0A6J1KDY7_CUCMA|nr:toll/interleukin-1 receptor-like protein [Cucurbita maxima]
MRESSSTSYDVFLSFRGEDTRTNFTSHLVMALRQKCVNVFIDDKLERGEQISESLFQSIERALISVVIFSKNYASSSWCLDELVKIIECKKSKDQKVLPIFYNVDPAVIRKQTGRFGEALAKHQAEFKTKIENWKEALTTAANLSGWHLRHRYERNEADFIQDIVKQVLCMLKHTCTPSYAGSTKLPSPSQPKCSDTNCCTPMPQPKCSDTNCCTLTPQPKCFDTNCCTPMPQPICSDTDCCTLMPQTKCSDTN